MVILSMSPKAAIVHQAYLSNGITSIEELSKLSGLSEVRTQTILKETQEGVLSGEYRFGFLACNSFLSTEAGKVITSQRKSFECELEVLESIMSKAEDGSRAWMAAQKRATETRKEIRELTGASTLLEVARVEAVRGIKTRELDNRSKTPVKEVRHSAFAAYYEKSESA